MNRDDDKIPLNVLLNGTLMFIEPWAKSQICSDLRILIKLYVINIPYTKNKQVMEQKYFSHDDACAEIQN